MSNKVNRKKAEDKIKESLSILDDLGVPRQQQNERSALTLLSLLGLKPASKWEDATDPLMGITPMMEFFEQHYGKKYAPNTRETVRRQTVHQFMQAALIVANPDKPSRPDSFHSRLFFAFRMETAAIAPAERTVYQFLSPVFFGVHGGSSPHGTVRPWPNPA
ncbi:MAG: hypothetical protein COX19_16125 [Desulfobacterales bacterium CG23_combo_of_CG06-09_8_20_14_all_51_8]|nr:MAG: hypothetical protein COX19_16125 [Desulfobacterales bacterium CG23_combo_of_CG06-09_8_20_14_all_51_8]